MERVKPLEDILGEGGDIDTALVAVDTPHSLKKTLGPISLTAMGIGAIIGTGIFVLTGVASAKYSGPSLTVSFIIAGVVSVFAALCYSEIASRVPVAGSAYTFTYASLGERFAWIIGWALFSSTHSERRRSASAGRATSRRSWATSGGRSPPHFSTTIGTRGRPARSCTAS